jgi:hypothetical protein
MGDDARELISKKGRQFCSPANSITTLLPNSRPATARGTGK